MLLGGAIDGNAARMPNSWLAVARCTLLLFCCMQGKSGVDVSGIYENEFKIILYQMSDTPPLDN